jgi:predicted transposase YbfD/YdcC
MPTLPATRLMFHLSTLEDPRAGDNCKHSFIEVVFIGVCAVISGCEHWTEIEDYAEAKREWLKSILSLRGGIPSHDTFRRVFCILDFKKFQTVFVNWTEEVRKSLKIKKDQICVDGKTLCGSANKSKLIKALHMVNAWSTGASLNLAQVLTEEKSNEITAIPHLLDLLNINDCLISIDAMGCQKEIANQIVAQGGDYLLAVKENQKYLYEAVEELFRRSSTPDKNALPRNDHKQIEQNIHGRDEVRDCRVLYLEKEVGFFPHDDWPSIFSLIKIQSERTIRSSGEKSAETRYYISSREESAEYFNEKVRAHW